MMKKHTNLQVSLNLYHTLCPFFAQQLAQQLAQYLSHEIQLSYNCKKVPHVILIN